MSDFTVLTLNCFGVPTPSTRRRLEMLAHLLNTMNADVVCLQEVQSHLYRRLLIRACTAYPYHAYSPFLHAPKGGLLTLSRYPIQNEQFELYRERGLWYTPALADWILHKGVLLTQVQCDGQPFSILNTHLTANYTGDWSPGNRFAQHEWEQLAQLAELVRKRSSDEMVIVAGDFNIPRGSWLAEQFLAKSGLTDPLHGDTRPTFRPLPGMPARYAAAIDFTLYRIPPALQGALHAEVRFRFEGKVAVHRSTAMHLSDHTALELHLSWRD